MDAFGVSPENVLPHHHFNPGKTCPNFEVSRVLKYLPDL
jgi:hypothetical protein